MHCAHTKNPPLKNVKNISAPQKFHALQHNVVDGVVYQTVKNYFAVPFALYDAEVFE